MTNNDGSANQTVSIPLSQYVDCIVALQKLDDIRRIVFSEDLEHDDYHTATLLTVKAIVSVHNKCLYTFKEAQPDIIRCKDCKDCKHVETARSKEAARKFGQIYICGKRVLLSPKPDDYCSWAERRTDERYD